VHGTRTHENPTDDVLVSGDLRLDLSAHQAWVGRQPIQLSHLQFVVLTTLLRQADRLVTHEQLIRATTDVTRSSPRTVRSTVSRIRLRLGTGPRRPRIVVQRKLGYRLLSPDTSGAADQNGVVGVDGPNARSRRQPLQVSGFDGAHRE
jgi:two-component system, OmpR family, KDP operon response regulator KdpE